MEQVTDVSIVIVNYNTLHVLRPCIDSIEAFTKGINYEIIVVDNGSTDGSAEQMSHDPRLIWIEAGSNLGFGRANNLGIERANGRYIFLLNSDTLLLNNAIGELYEFAVHYEGKLGALGCVLENRKGEAIHSYGNFPRMRDDFNKLVFVPIKKALGFYKKRSIPLPERWMKVDYVTGADLIVARSVLEECGAFHPAFFMYCEETEME
ncbi:MAG: glycosyltransferase family 2 protein, partial [Prevotella sp.]|nr:glycosyltransferase family 2 protein [Prevotella sp.]